MQKCELYDNPFWDFSNGSEKNKKKTIIYLK